jgi:CheY-like chemotaxis protein
MKAPSVPRLSHARRVGFFLDRAVSVSSNRELPHVARYLLRSTNMGSEFSRPNTGTYDVSPISTHEVRRNPARSLELAQLRVLVVDDDPQLRRLVGAVLQRAGATVQTADSTRTALQSFNAFKPHVLVSDIEMPGGDGYSLMRQLRAFPAADGGETPAIALSGLPDIETQARALRAGFAVHMGKPFIPAELVRAVAALAAHAATAADQRTKQIA